MKPWSELEAAVAGQLSGERLVHVHRVVETARELADRFGAPREQAEVAGLLHDFARAMPASRLLAEARSRGLIIDPVEAAFPALLHGPVGAALVAERGLVSDGEVLGAIRWHTTGRAGMSLLERVVWLADYIEPGRTFDGVEPVRAVASRDLDKALLMALDSTIGFVIGARRPLHVYTVHARNWLLEQFAGRSKKWPGRRT